MKLFILKRAFLILTLLGLFNISTRAQEEDDEEDDEYDDEEPTTAPPATTKKYRVRPSSTTTLEPLASGRNDSVTSNGNSTKAVAQSSSATTLASSSAAVAATTRSPPPLPPTRSPVRATTLSESQEEEVTEEEGLGYIFRPLTNLIDNVVAGNISGIVDNALSIRTPPEIRSFVNNVMTNVFGASIGGALKQFVPAIFSTVAPPIPGRDPIPEEIPAKTASDSIVNAISSAILPKPLPTIGQGTVSIIEARTNSTEEPKVNKKEPIQLKFTHPGAPASRLRCEIIAD